MFSFLTELQINLSIGVAALTLGVLFSQQIKDKIRGIPGDVRTALKGVEVDTVAKIKEAQASVLAELPAPASVKLALAPFAQGGLVPAPAPAAAPAPAPAPAPEPAPAPPATA